MYYLPKNKLYRNQIYCDNLFQRFCAVSYTAAMYGERINFLRRNNNILDNIVIPEIQRLRIPVSVIWNYYVGESWDDNDYIHYRLGPTNLALMNPGSGDLVMSVFRIFEYARQFTNVDIRSTSEHYIQMWIRFILGHECRHTFQDDDYEFHRALYACDADTAGLLWALCGIHPQQIR